MFITFESKDIFYIQLFKKLDNNYKKNHIIATMCYFNALLIQL